MRRLAGLAGAVALSTIVTAQVPQRRIQVLVGPSSARYVAEEQVVELAGDQAVDRLEIKLQRAATISGRILDEHGEPLALARIRVFRIDNGRQQEYSGQVGFGSLTYTDDPGRLRVFGLAAGEYAIAAEPSATPHAADAAAPTRQLVTCYPGTPNAALAAPIKVDFGMDAELAWSVVRGGTLTIAGTVLDSRGQPLAGALVSVTARTSDTGFRGSGVTTSVDGTFVARNVDRVAPGRDAASRTAYHSAAITFPAFPSS